LRWQAEAGLAELHAEQGFASEAEREYRKSIDTIEAARASINRDDLRLSFLSGAIEFYDDYIDFLIRHNRFADALRVAELSRARTLEEGLTSTAEAASLSQKRVRPQQIAQKLRASLLFYWIGHNHSYLWVITPSETAYFKLAEGIGDRAGSEIVSEGPLRNARCAGHARFGWEAVVRHAGRAHQETGSSRLARRCAAV